MKCSLRSTTSLCAFIEMGLAVLLLLLPLLLCPVWSSEVTAEDVDHLSGKATTTSCGGPSALPAGCLCGYQLYQNTMQYVVNCTNTNLRNTSVLEHMPLKVQVLIFTGNHIEELPWNVFGTINNYTELRVVDMSNNHIRDIRGKSYHHVQNVERLILNHNNLSISHNTAKEGNHHHPRVFSNFVNLISLHLTDAFDDNGNGRQLSEDLHDIFMESKLQKLQKLHMEQNEISVFKDRRVFCDLPNLMDLHLGDNNLTDINFDLDCIKNLRFLDLKRNKFNYIKIEDLLHLDRIDRLHNNSRATNLIVDFDLNPFTCDCRITPLLVWLHTTNVTVRNYENFYCQLNATTDLNTSQRFPLMLTNMSHCKAIKMKVNAIFHSSMHEITTKGCPNDCGLSLEYNEKTLLHQDNSNDDDDDADVLQQHNSNVKHLHVLRRKRLNGLIFVFVMLGVVLVILLPALAYIHRTKLKWYLSPVLQTATKKVYYTTIHDESCPEVHV